MELAKEKEVYIEDGEEEFTISEHMLRRVAQERRAHHRLSGLGTMVIKVPVTLEKAKKISNWEQ